MLKYANMKDFRNFKAVRGEAYAKLFTERRTA